MQLFGPAAVKDDVHDASDEKDEGRDPGYDLGVLQEPEGNGRQAG